MVGIVALRVAAVVRRIEAFAVLVYHPAGMAVAAMMIRVPSALKDTPTGGATGSTATELTRVVPLTKK